MSDEPATAIAVSPVADVTGDLHLIARSPAEMKQAQAAFVSWIDAKIAIVEKDAAEAAENWRIAVENNWKSGTFERQSKLADARVRFYRKMKAIAEAGYCIVPNFPIDLFAIRTTRRTPDKQESSYQHSSHEQRSNAPPLGEGDYVNPQPEIAQRLERKRKPDTGELITKTLYYAADFNDEIEFPISVARPEIMSATVEAMALKAFDEIGVQDGRRRGDPLVIGRIIDPRDKYRQRFASFIIAWYVDTSAL
jgi:hypothetical protein